MGPNRVELVLLQGKFFASSVLKNKTHPRLSWVLTVLQTLLSNKPQQGENNSGSFLERWSKKLGLEGMHSIPAIPSPGLGHISHRLIRVIVQHFCLWIFLFKPKQEALETQSVGEGCEGTLTFRLSLSLTGFPEFNNTMERALRGLISGAGAAGRALAWHTQGSVPSS